MNFKALVEKIKTGKYMANYQPVVICHLVRSPELRDTKKGICQSLKDNNKSMKKEISYFMSVPVWKVLEKHQVISRIEGGYKLNSSLSSTEKRQILKLCKELI